ncbi:class I SAM-dependent methyltransferase [uncultured Maribacter sp.]|uniref:class I SAM-dependent methyltransferase n=1 Tax=uncultured Maribacter sp. TaxID=431308 RepID=UPI0030EC1978|tara:strand:- start:11830 stop:12666 length:837 start_codon:yes stop_codon:yes gene_type:complete
MLENKIFLKTKDHLVTQETFNLVKDSTYDMLITEPQPKNLDDYYQEENYISHSDDAKSVFEKIYQIVKSYTLRKKIKLINQYSLNGKNILDIGCGTGEFLAYAKNNNWKTFGVEPNIKARQKALEKNLNIVEKLELINAEKFNVISLWHVLEHLPNLQEHIVKIKNILSDQGTLIIAVPNYKSYDAAYYKENWAAYDTPRHLWHFSQNSITEIFNEHNFKVVKTLPMHFDSYYVSLLSEKYKNGRTNYLKAIFRGLLSNLNARRSGEYSSLIYILKRE